MRLHIKNTVPSILLALFPCLLLAQGIKIGQQVPNTEFNHVINYRDSSIRLTEFKGKLIILDFWGPTCIGCLELFPKMDTLQKEFKDKIQIILVNKESKDSTLRFFRTHKLVKMPSTPLITQANLLYQYFPHIGEPFHVWIDSTGIVRYITNGSNTKSKQISEFLKGKDPSLPLFKKSKYVETLFDPKWSGKVPYYSYIVRCIDHGSLHITGSGADSTLGNSLCFSISELYLMAFNEGGKYNFNRPGRLVLEVTDSSKYFLQYNSQNSEIFNNWSDSNAYYYRLQIPESRINEKYKYMKEDLNRYFDLNARVEKRNVKCLTLVRTTKADLLHTKGGAQKNTFYRTDPKTDLESIQFDSVRCLINQPFQKFSSTLQNIIEIGLSEPFIDATRYKGNIDIRISGKAIDSLNIVNLRKELKKYGLDLVEQAWPLQVLVISEKSD